MEGKINRLRTILIIGTVILFLAGISFLFVNSVESYLKTLTMGLISGVLYYLSYYEEKTLKFKGSSITTYIFACVGVLATYISTGFYKFFGEWFAVNGEGTLIFIASIIFLAALLVLVSAVKYKVYKLIELSIWLTIIAVAFVIKHFDVNGKYIIITLLGLALIKNFVNFNNYSRWLSFVIALVGIFSIDEKAMIPTLIITTLVVANSLLVLFKNDKVQIIPIILSYVSILVTGIVFKNVLISVSVMAILELLFAYTKVIKNNEVRIISKVVINLAYLASLPSAASNEIFKYVVPAIIFGASLLNVLIFKDDVEENLLPFKLLYFTVIELYYLPIDVFKEYLIVFVSNIVVVLMYFLAKKSNVKSINLVLLALINLFTVLRMSKVVFPNIIYLVLFALDFYIISVNEEKGKIPLSIVFVLYSFFLFSTKMQYLDASFALAVAVFYFMFLVITRKNKIVFATSIVGFIVSTLTYLNSIITDNTLLFLIGDFLFLGGVILFEKTIVEKPSNKATLYGTLISLQIVANAFSSYNVVLKIFALLEGIGLIALSIKDDKYKVLYADGLVFVIVTLFCIINSIASLPKTMYLILIGLTIVIITPLIINKYTKLNEELKLKEEEERKKREEEIKKLQKNKKYKLNYCPDCGTQVKDTYAFCSKCGRKIR